MATDRDVVGQMIDCLGNVVAVQRLQVNVGADETVDAVPAIAGKAIYIFSVRLKNNGSTNEFHWLSNLSGNYAHCFPIISQANSQTDTFERNQDGWLQTFSGEGLSFYSQQTSCTVNITYGYVADSTTRSPGGIGMATDSQQESGAAHTATITVNRSNGTNGVATVHFDTSNDTAVAGVNYTAVHSTITFNDGVGSATVGVPILTGDAVDVKFFNCTLSAPGGGAVLVGDIATGVAIDHL